MPPKSREKKKLVRQKENAGMQIEPQIVSGGENAGNAFHPSPGSVIDSLL